MTYKYWDWRQNQNGGTCHYYCTFQYIEILRSMEENLPHEGLTLFGSNYNSSIIIRVLFKRVMPRCRFLLVASSASTSTIWKRNTPIPFNWVFGTNAQAVLTNYSGRQKDHRKLKYGTEP